VKEGVFTNSQSSSVRSEAYRQPPPPIDHVPLHLADLQKVSESVLTAAKDQMNELFEKNFVTSNDENYVYDKRVEFNVGEAEPSDWDD
jgi:hypothetical protein